MRARVEPHRKREVLRWALALYLAWTLTWVAYSTVVSRAWPSLGRGAPGTIFWSACKLVVWLLPVLVIVRRSRREAPLAWLGLDHARGLARGVVATVLFVGLAALVDARVPGQWPVPAVPNRQPVPEILLIALWGPFVEEVLFRGYVLRSLLEAGTTFWRANLMATSLFALLHVPGWLFHGLTVADCAVFGLRVGFLGFLFGALRVRGASLWPSVLMHVVNNAWRAGWLLFAWDAMT
ncbi:MAG TPA: CPBP family intramembrane glutamic endopeptidase [Polyangiaceae bacterium]|nr:CPBP family intramembrane glutamic endopeptidase [Polyangiaceae bacterium]